MSSGSYCPEAGDLIWLNFDPQRGREQAGRRPALVLTPYTYNHRRTVCVVCPITSQVKGYPFEVPLPSSSTIHGVVLADQIKSLSWLERGAVFAERADAIVVADAKAKLQVLLEF